jgi:putative exosortase-associated protein (TIGR04073 family)
MSTFAKLLPLLFLILPFASEAQTYPAKMGEKLGAGLANTVTGVAELPKTIALATEKEGAAYGLTVGFATGLSHMLGRTLCGAFDLVTFPIATEALVKPNLIWKNFSRETTYNLHLKMR